MSVYQSRKADTKNDIFFHLFMSAFMIAPVCTGQENQANGACTDSAEFQLAERRALRYDEWRLSKTFLQKLLA